MKIIQLIYGIGSGGAERFVVNLANCLVEMGHEVEVCILLDDSFRENSFLKQFLKPGVSFHSFKFKPGLSLRKIIQVDSYIKSKKPDVVHCHLNVIPYIFALAYRNKGIRFVHTIHTVADKAAGASYQYRLNRFFYKKEIIQPVAISLRCQESFKAFYHLDNAPCIDNGCVTVEPSSCFEQVGVEVEQLKNGKDIPVFIHVARFDSPKNQDLLIDVFNKLSKEGLEFILLIIGDGFQKVKATELRNRACRYIHFLGVKGNVGDYLMHSDAFCLTSRYEGLPISLLEAMSAGVTPICTPVGGIPDVIQEGVTGYLSEEVTLPSYIAAIRRFLNCKLDATILKQHFKNHFSMQACTKKYIEVYKNFIHESK